MTDHEEIWEAFVAGVDVGAAIAEKPGGRLDRTLRDEHKQRVLEYKLRVDRPPTRMSLSAAMEEAADWLKRRRAAEERLTAYAARKRAS